MPHIVFYNLIDLDFEKKNIDSIEKAIIGVVTGMKELDLTQEDISFSFLVDPTIVSRKIPIIVIVELLFEKKERTFEVRERLANELGQAIKLTISGWRYMAGIEVAVKRFDPKKDGFYSIQCAA